MLLPVDWDKNGLQFTKRLHVTLACKKSQEIFFQYAVSFSPAEYEYETNFFPSRSDVPKFYGKSLKINKIGWL